MFAEHCEQAVLLLATAYPSIQLKQVTTLPTSRLQDLQFEILVVQSLKTQTFGMPGLLFELFARVYPDSQVLHVTPIWLGPRYAPVQDVQCEILMEQAVQLSSS